MDIITHLIFGFIIGYFFHGVFVVQWLPAIFGALFPDIVGEVFYQIGRVSKGKRAKFVYDEEVSKSSSYLGSSIFLYPYNLTHSFVVVPFLFLLPIPLDFTVGYLSHLLLDLVSHSKKTWGIMIFWPFSKKRFGVDKDWWQWKFFKKIYKTKKLQ